MRRTLLCLFAVTLLACGKDSITNPPDDDSIPTDLLPDEGILRFTLSTNCPQMTLAFGVDQFLYGPETLSPGQSRDYHMGAGVHTTSAKSFPVASTTFPSESITVPPKARATRTLSC